MTYRPQVSADHYRRGSYASNERWNAYFHQLELVCSFGAATVLEVGVGGGVVARELRAQGIVVTTLDIAEDLHPDVIGSVTEIPLPDHSFDVVLAAEVLEHIRFEDVPQALKEVARVARKGVVLSVPAPGYVFSLTFKIPFVSTTSLLGKIPFFWEKHAFNGEHYWELGKRGYSEPSFLTCAQTAGLRLAHAASFADDPAHRFFSFTL